MNEEIVIIIQARMGSTRLPNKMILDFHKSKNILEIIIDKLLSVFSKNQIILATTTNPKDEELENIAEKKDILSYRGDENNVLKRFIDCAKYFGRKKIIRVCADNPFLDLLLMKKLIANAENKNYDYVSYVVNQTPAIKTHYGFFCEYVTLDTLLRVYNETNDQFFIEHVTNYIYTHSEMFRIKWLETPEIIANEKFVRLTIDTIEDFKMAQSIYNSIREPITYNSIISYLNMKREFKDNMLKQIRKNEK